MLCYPNLSDFFCFQQQAGMGYHTYFHLSRYDDVLGNAAYLSHHLQWVENVDSTAGNGCCLTDGGQSALCVPINTKYGYGHITTSSIFSNLKDNGISLM